MKIDLTEIYKGLKAWRHERGITLESQKKDYLVNVMREFGKLSQALRDYEKIKNGERVTRTGIFDIKSTLGEMTIFEGTTKGELEISLEKVEHEIIDALCNISVFTINAGTDIPCSVKRTEIELKKSSLDTDYILKQLVERCAGFSYFDSWGEASAFNIILANCAYLCEQYGYNFQTAMLETIKELSSRTGSYDEKSNYEKERIEKMNNDNNEFYAVCERATDLMHIAIINKDYGKAELAYFKTLDEAEEFLRNLEIYKEGKTTFMNSRFARMVEYYVEEFPSYKRVQHIFFIEKKTFFGNVRS